MLTTASTIALIAAFKDKILSTAKELKEDISHFLDDGLVDYIKSIQDKFQYTKTFLYRQENIYFYDIFFPVSINIRSANKSVTSCEGLFSESNFVSIIGTAGSGKTMLMKHFFLESVQTQYKIPLFIELRNLNDFQGSFTDLIYKIVLNNRLAPTQKILEKILESGNFILLLDGYDEIYSDRKSIVTNDIDMFIDRYSNNHYIISSRPNSGLDSLPRFNNYKVSELSELEIETFIDKVLYDSEDIDLAPKIKSVIKQTENKDYASFLASPLLLSMFILTFKQYPELPTKKSKFYWNVFDTLAIKHDSFTKRGGYQHERKSGLENETFEKILQWFSFKSLFSGKVTFDAEYLQKTLTDIKNSLNITCNVNLLIEDLTIAISIILIDGIEYRFPHKSMQEYFAASLIKDLPLKSKIKVYQEHFVQLEFNTVGGSFNLWSLTRELDHSDFNSYFIIYFLKKFLEKMPLQDSKVKLREFFRIFNIKEGYEEIPGSLVHFDGSIMYSSTYGIYKSIFAFLQIDFIPLHGIANVVNKRAKVRFINYFKTIKDDERNIESYSDSAEVRLYFSPNIHWSIELENMFEISNIFKDFEKFLNTVAEQINNLEHIIQKEQATSLDLLKL